MIRKKQLFVVILLGILVLIGVFLFLLFSGVSTKNSNTGHELHLFPFNGITGVEVDKGTDRKSARDDLLLKLKDYEAGSGIAQGSANNNTIKEEQTKAEWPEGGVPLGDGLISTSPRVGSIYSCQQQVLGSAHETEPWIEDAYWFPAEKVAVDGAVMWESDAKFTEAEGVRLITTNALPSHTTGVFPIRPSDDAYSYDKNPNSITAQLITVQLPTDPTIGPVPSCLPMGIVGVSKNGIPLFNGLDAEGRDAPAHEVQDECGGHPEESGTYHYHNESQCLLTSVYEGAASTLVGYARDGFGIFSSVEDGKGLTNDDLDACHGHIHTIPWDGQLVSMYHYHMTKEYPYTLGCFMGTSVDISKTTSNEGSMPQGGAFPSLPPQDGGHNPPPPQP